ncbi:MAG: DUF3577 domain-containing protein [Rubrivivax sp.]|nr:DUF3577 domain-containing protein [Rubrivivax sp.]
MSQTNETKAFDFIAEGIGYLNRVREIRPSGKGKAYLACTINAMMGPADSVEYVSVDCKVVGRVAIEAIGQLKPHVEAKKKVIVAFRVGDPKPDFYEYKDRATGEPRSGQGLKARLLQLTSAKVDGAKIEIPLVPRGDSPELRAGEDDDGVGTACEDGAVAAT